MKLVVGLGNPGSQYAETRHNVGYQVVDRLSERWGIPCRREKFRGLIGEGHACGVSVLLLKPTTFMNHSGQAVGEAWRFYRLEVGDLLVILDDMDLPLGRIRLRPAGAAGGHRGLSDIILMLGRDDFARVRIGIGGSTRNEAIEHVLGRFEPEELPHVEPTVGRAEEAVECWMTEGIEQAMNRYNGPTDAMAGE
jgi:PTH1 family peptidyl-tRNA hydrolase